MDTIFIEGLRVPAQVGVYAWEMIAPQTLELNFEIGMPSAAAGRSDDLVDTIDYGQVVGRVRATLAERQFLLLEALAEHLADLVLREFGAPWVRVRAAKIGLLRGVARLGVSIERRQ